MKLKNKEGRVVELRQKPKNYIPINKFWKLALKQAAEKNLRKA